MEELSLDRKLKRKVRDCWLNDLSSVPNLIIDFVKAYSHSSVLPRDLVEGVIGVPDLDSLHFISLGYPVFPDLEQGQVIALWGSKFFGCDYDCVASFVFDGKSVLVSGYHYPKFS